MAEFTHGLNAKLLLGGYNISEFFKSASLDASKDTVETTAFGSTAKTFIGGLRDASASLEGMFDGSSTPGSDEILEATLAAESSEFSLYPDGDAQGDFGFGMTGIQTAYAVSASTDDVIQASAELQANGGAARVQSLHPLGAESSTGNGSSVNNGAATTDGGVGFIHVTAVPGTSVAAKIEHSTNDSTWADLVTFTTATDLTSERIAVTGTVNQYLRVSYTMVGAATFQVGFARQ